MKDTHSALIRTRHPAAGLAPAVLLLAGCGGSDDDGLAGRTVCAMTNGSAGDEVIAFRREGDGSLPKINADATGGTGLGTTEISRATPQDGVDTLASQGSLRMTPGKRFVLAVNAASNAVTGSDGLECRGPGGAMGEVRRPILAHERTNARTTNARDARDACMPTRIHKRLRGVRTQGALAVVLNGS
ncbi:MAG: hypothetical protein ABIN96_01145 [Rubrivivax sp.]